MITSPIRTIAVLALSLALSPQSYAVLVQITSPTDNVGAVGDFAVVQGNDESSSPGQVLSLLDMANNPTQTSSATVNMGQLWQTLNAEGITSTNSLKFGFGVNETGASGTNSVDITGLTLTFERTGNPNKTFDLGSNTIEVFNFGSGQSTAEARIQVNLGFDFMAEYNSGSTEDFTIASTITGKSDGSELYFLSAGFTAVPEPSAVFLVGLVAAATMSVCGLRKKFSSDVQQD